jgi:membrane fusion protein, copper/silver efflux system
MKAIRLLAGIFLIGLIFVFGFGYGRWYSTRPAPKKPRHILYYVDPMHPQYTSDKPGVAPDCGMKLQPVYADEGPKAQPGSPSLEPPSPNSIHVTPDQQQTIGLRYGAAEWSSVDQPIHAVGRVTVDETRTTRVQSRSDGWIDKVFADFNGKLIDKGQALLTLYSPELLATQKELLLAIKAKGAMQHSSMSGTMANSDALIDAARQRLRLLNLSDAEIENLERTGEPIRSITLYASAGGYVTGRNAFPGQRVTAETDLYTLADLNQVWVMADIFEADAQQVRIGQTARVSLQGAAGGSMTAKIAYIQPQIDPATRTMKVRLELANPAMRLKPDMFVEVDLSTGGERRLTVPAEAVLDAGTTKTVFIDRANGFFEPREIETGERSGDRVEVLKGLKAGDRIVTSGVFLLNSESQLRSAAGKNAE